MSVTETVSQTRTAYTSRSSTLMEPEVRIGPDILELFSSAMYVDPITVYREYVQNAADAIDEARSDGVLAPDEPGRVDITIDPQARSVRIRDNGCGVDSEAFGRRLLALGGSEKRTKSARGFRGVGRLAGLGYARNVIFRASAAGEPVTSELRWDCRLLKATLSSPDCSGSLADVVKSVTALRQEDGTNASEHFFEVELDGVVRLSSDQLTSPSAISAYLSQVAPVPFAPHFRFGNDITKALSSRMNLSTLLIYVDGGAEPVYRPHRNQMVCGDQRQVAFETVDIVEFPGIDGGVAAVAWILHHEYEGALPPRTLVKGLRVRTGNMQVGGHALLDELFPETRFNGWSVGEVHILDKRIVPNGRRDQLEPNVHYYNLLNHLLPTTRAIARRCRTSSVRRRWEQEFEMHARTSEEKLGIIAQGTVGKAKSDRLVLEVEKTLLKMSTISEMKILRQHASAYAARIAALRSGLAALMNDKTPSESPLSRLAERERRSYERIFELIYECSVNRVVAKSLIDRILMRIG